MSSRRNDISATVFWSDEDDCFIAVDVVRPGCSAAGETRAEAYRELQDTRQAWDRARAAVTNGDN